MNWRIVIAIGWFSVGIYRLVSWFQYRWECSNSIESCVGYPFSSIINDILGRDFVWNGFMTASILLLAAFLIFKKIRYAWLYVVPLSIYIVSNCLAIGLIAISEAESPFLQLMSMQYITSALSIATIWYSLRKMGK